jgi:hypothetical protein
LTLSTLYLDRRGAVSETSHDAFDVFMAHNSQDRPQVEAVGEALRRRGLKPWLDQEQVPPGRWFQDVIQATIPHVKSAAIFIGPKGLGRWQVVELRAFLSECIDKGIPVIPVLLPGVNTLPEKLRFLRELHRVSFATGIGEEGALDDLEWGIRGVHPKRGAGAALAPAPKRETNSSGAETTTAPADTPPPIERTSAVQQRLINHWLPRLREQKRKRRPRQRLVVAALLMQLLLAILFLAHCTFGAGDHRLVEALLGALLLGLSPLCLVYLATIRACHEGLLLIELAVVEGSPDRIRDAIRILSCFGPFREVLNDVRRIAAGEE